jgi:inward rectifier potassium channel
MDARAGAEAAGPRVLASEFERTPETHKADHHHAAQASDRKTTRRITINDRTIITHGLRIKIWRDLFHYLMKVSWPTLFGTFATFFLLLNFGFACIYWLSTGDIANLNPQGFWGGFFFSVETLATVGYGDMHPITLYGHVVAAIEIFVGMTCIALMTGAMFARFSRPQALFLFANSAVVRPFDGKKTLMFRAANARQNVVMEASAQLRLLKEMKTEEGYSIRRVIDLPLVRSQHPVFLLSWTIMHVIDETSPLVAETAESLAAANAMFLLNLSGIDETTGQLLMARYGYKSSAIHWNHTFRDILHTGADGLDHVDYAKFNLTDALENEAGSKAS